MAFLGVVASLAAGEFLKDRAKPILIATLGFSMFTFALMAFAQNMIAEHDSVASLFTYMGVTAVVKYVAPFRARDAES